MRKFTGTAMLGIKDKETNKLIAVYPDPLDGNDDKAEDRVKFWFYQQSCEAEETLRKCYVDVLSEEEKKAQISSKAYCKGSRLGNCRNDIK